MGETSASIEEQRQIAALQEMFGAEDLHPDLVPYLYHSAHIGPVLKHPLVESVPHAAALNKWCNKLYAQQKPICEQARAAGNWHRYVHIHTKPWRFTALTEIADEMPHDEFWRMMAHVWTTVENVHENAELWLDHWRSQRPGRVEHAMEPKEQHRLAALPDQFTIYRGARLQHHVYGICWTLDRKVALWYANRYSFGTEHPAHIATAHVHKSDVIAHFTRRSTGTALNEREIVVDYQDIDIIDIDPVKHRSRQSK